ncbi:DUF4307 domain-containing protein [Cellulomonas sp. URHB0016]
MTPTPGVQPPEGRYGPAVAPRTGVRRWLGWAVLGVVAVGLLVWVAIGVVDQPVSWKDVGYHVDDATSVQVTFEVTKPRDDTVSCRVQALSQSFAEVGVRTVEVGPAETGTRRVTVTVPTAELAVSGTVASCDRLEPGGAPAVDGY